MSAGGPILVTGATGFLGGRVAEALARRGDRVRLLCREGRAASLPALAPGLAEVATGDLRDEPSLRRAAAGCSAVVHCAARVARGGSRADFAAANVDGLRAVLRAAGQARVPRVVVTSSFFALGSSGGREGGVDERALAEDAPSLDHYQATKHESALLARRAMDAGAPIVVLYPGVILGPGRLTEGNFVTGMVRDHLCGRLVPLPAGGRRQWSFVHVDDVAAGHLAALDDGTLGEAYVLGGENATLRDAFAVVQDLTGRTPPRLSAPGPLMWSIGAGEEALERLVGRAPRQLTRGVARVLDRDWALDSRKAARELGWSPRPLREALRETIAWLEQERLVPAGTLRQGAA